jgi:hypothetical protein
MNEQATGTSHQSEGQQDCLNDVEGQYTASSEQQECSHVNTTDPGRQPPCKGGLPADQNAANGALHGVNTGSLAGILLGMRLLPHGLHMITRCGTMASGSA